MTKVDYLDKAKKAAEESDAMGMLVALTKSDLIERFQNHFSKKFSIIPKDDLSDIIGMALDDLFVRIRNKQKILKIDSYLYKSINNIALKYKSELITREGNIDIERIGLDVRYDFEEKKDIRREAIKITKTLLPRLGQKNIQLVIEYLIVCIENGVQDIKSVEIGEALGLSGTTVRKCIERGLSRLSRIVKDEGIIDEIDLSQYQNLITYIIDEDNVEEAE